MIKQESPGISRYIYILSYYVQEDKSPSLKNLAENDKLPPPKKPTKTTCTLGKINYGTKIYNDKN